MYLGRYQLGQEVKIGLPTVDGSGNPVQPDSAPTAVITHPDAIVDPAVKLAMDGGPTAFALGIDLGYATILGTYTVSYSYQAGVFAGSGGDTFDVIAGGDPGGRIISMTAYDRPEASYVVAQISSGRIVQGRNPSL
jgi:hypothetical protein